jgi:hypothetical protein
MRSQLSTGIFNRELTLAAISEGGGLAKDMFVRIRTAFNGGQRVSAETYMNNDHLPIAEHVRVAVLLVGELSKSKQQAKIITMRCVDLSAALYLIA